MQTNHITVESRAIQNITRKTTPIDYVATTVSKSAADVFGHLVANSAIYPTAEDYFLDPSNRSSDATPEEYWRMNGERVELLAYYESQDYRQHSRQTHCGKDEAPHEEFAKRRPTAVDVPGIAFQ